MTHWETEHTNSAYGLAEVEACSSSISSTSLPSDVYTVYTEDTLITPANQNQPSLPEKEIRFGIR
jgi:hypothetical protein